MKKIIGILLILTIIASCAYANFISYPLKKLDQTIININEPIKSIWLCLQDADCDITEVLKDMDLDFDDAENIYSIHPGAVKNSNAYFTDDVDLFSDEDYVFDYKYDMKNYRVIGTIDYSYDFEDEDGNSTGTGTSHKFKNMDELIKELGPEYKDQDISCTRSIAFSAYKLIDEKEIPVSEIVDGKLKITLTDFSKIDEIKTGYVVRFENENGEFKTIGLDTHDYWVDHEITPGQDVKDGYRDVVVDYNTLEYITNEEPTKVQDPAKEITEESGSTIPVITPSIKPAEQESTPNYLLICCALAILLIVVVVIIFISNGKKK